MKLTQDVLFSIFKSEHFLRMYDSIKIQLQIFGPKTIPSHIWMSKRNEEHDEIFFETLRFKIFNRCSVEYVLQRAEKHIQHRTRVFYVYLNDKNILMLLLLLLLSQN